MKIYIAADIQHLSEEYTSYVVEHRKMGSCVVVGRKKIEPFESDSSIRRTVVLPSPSRILNRPRNEPIRIHKRVDLTYEIYASIGSGTFGHVIRVQHKATKKPYAIKIIDISKDVNYEKKLEIEILRSVDHKYVIKLHHVISTPGKLYLVMDLATGGELFDRVFVLGHFDERQAARVLSMILEGIEYLHSVGITHRDLKPENILYYHNDAESSHILITDFGLATIRDTVNVLMNTDCGTIEYMAPEVIMKDPYTNSVDMWSIGVITFILLSGKMPFSVKGNIYSLLRSICFGKYELTGEPWDKISQEAKAFIRSLLVQEQSKRLTASEALQHKWIKKTLHKKANLHNTVSSNWAESCLSLNSLGSSTRKPRKPDQTTEHLKWEDSNSKRSAGMTFHAIDGDRTSLTACRGSKQCLQSDENRQRDDMTMEENVDKHMPSHVKKCKRETSGIAEDANSSTCSTSSLTSRKKQKNLSKKQTARPKDVSSQKTCTLPPLRSSCATMPSTWKLKTEPSISTTQ